MKIAIFQGNIPCPPFIENLILSLIKEGHTVFLFGKKVSKFHYPEGVKVFIIPQQPVKLGLFVLKYFVKIGLSNPALAFSSFEFIKNYGIRRGTYLLAIVLPVLYQNPDVLHIQWTNHVIPELFDRATFPIVFSLRGTHINYSPIANSHLAHTYRKYFPRVAGFHAVSQAIAKEAMKYGASPGKIKIIYSAVQPDLLEKSSDIYHPGKPLQIVSVGRFHWIKGYSYALDACKLLKERGINFQYTIIADGNIPEELIFQLHQHDLSDVARIIPGMPHKKLIEYIQGFNLLLLPSLKEGIANVVLEAMAIGLPVISTDSGGMNEVINDKQNGFLVPVRSPEAIADSIEYFMNLSKDERIHLIQNAKQTILVKFSFARLGGEFSAFYQAALNGKNYKPDDDLLSSVNIPEEMIDIS